MCFNHKINKIRRGLGPNKKKLKKNKEKQNKKVDHLDCCLLELPIKKKRRHEPRALLLSDGCTLKPHMKNPLFNITSSLAPLHLKN